MAQEPTIRHLIKELKERKGFFEFYKKRLLPKHSKTCGVTLEGEQRSFQDDFFRKCDQEHVNPLPALNKVRNKVFNLTGYALNAGNCKALEEGLRVKISFAEQVCREWTTESVKFTWKTTTARTTCSPASFRASPL